MSEAQIVDKQEPVVFSFGDPISMLDRREILDYIECWSNGRWYETPVSLDGLAKSLRPMSIMARPFMPNAIFWLRPLFLIQSFLWIPLIRWRWIF